MKECNHKRFAESVECRDCKIEQLKEAIGWAAYLAKGRHCTESEAMEWLELVKNNAIEDERTRNDPE